MNIWVTGDLHGQFPRPPKKPFDAIIAPGDFGSDAAGKFMFEAMKTTPPGEKYRNWHDIVGRKKATAMVQQSVRDGRKVLKYLNTFGVPVYVVPGNWDWTGDAGNDLAIVRKNSWKTMIHGLKNIHDIDMKIVNTKECSIIGYGKCFGPELAQYSDDKKRIGTSGIILQKRKYAIIMKKLASLFKKIKKPVIFLSHNVPFNTSIDKIINPSSPKNGRHYGSVVARDIIKKYQPMLSIGGHMHEHYRTYRMGKTIALNTGFGPDKCTLITISEEKISIALHQ